MAETFHAGSGSDAFNDFNDYSSSSAYQPRAQAQSQQSFDNFYSFTSPSDVAAPHPDLFDSELDSSLAGIDEFDLQLLTVDSHDAFNYLRSDTPTHGPPSSITSDSAYNDSISSYSGSYYNDTPSNYSFPLDLEMEFRRIAVDQHSGAAAYPATAPLDALDPATFAGLSPTPPVISSPPNAYDRVLGAHQRSSYSDYGMPSRSAGPPANRYYDSLAWHGQAAHPGQATVAPGNINPNQTPIVPSTPMDSHQLDRESNDPHKKYRCAICPRGKFNPFSINFHLIYRNSHSLCSRLQLEDAHVYS